MTHTVVYFFFVQDPNDLELSESEVNNSSQDSTACSDNLDSGSTSSSESASSEYSDWIKDEGEVLEPPKRRSKRIPRSAPKPTKKSEDLKVIDLTVAVTERKLMLWLDKVSSSNKILHSTAFYFISILNMTTF